MKTELCSNCGEMARVISKDYSFDEMGVPVELKDIDVIECPHCGNTDPIIPNMDGLMHVVAVAALCKPCKLSGEEVRYLRKYVNKSAHEFSRFLHVDHTHLSKIENGRVEIGPRLDKLVRLMVMNMDQRLADSIKELMELMPNIEDVCSESQGGIQINPASLTYQYA